MKTAGGDDLFVQALPVGLQCGGPLVALRIGERRVGGYRVELLPGSDFPALIGAVFLRHEVREQLEAIVQEMLRRQGAATPPS